MALFERDALRDDTGLQKPRYLQEMSTLVSESEAALAAIGSPTTMYTVPAGKVFYCDTIVYSAAASTHIVLHDGAASNIKIIFDTDTASDTRVINLNTPIAFTETVRAVYNGFMDSLNIIGWIEDA